MLGDRVTRLFKTVPREESQADLKGEVDLLTRARLPSVTAISDINQTTTELRPVQ